MKLSLPNFKKEFLDHVLEFLWDQWSAIGVSGHAGNPKGRVIDPEALLIFTTVFGRYEPRLFDEVLDWLRLNGDLINLQRLNNLYEDHDFGDLNVLAAMADQLGDKAVLRKWRRVAALLDQYGGNKPAPLFRAHDGSSLPIFGPHEERFAKFALIRGKFEFRGLSQRPNPTHPENLLFKLRSFFGLNARSEVILYLLTHSISHPRRIAEQIGYSPRTVENTLNEMELSDKGKDSGLAQLDLFALFPAPGLEGDRAAGRGRRFGFIASFRNAESAGENFP